MTILDEIVANRKKEVAEVKSHVSLEELKKQVPSNRKGKSLKEQLLDPEASGIIAEFKRKSPSKGIINDKVTPEIVTKGYSTAGASGISVLTDRTYFGGSLDDFAKAREANPDTPMLRKDFMVDEYQIYEACVTKADVILLIAAVLTKEEIERFTTLAHELGLEVLLELHAEEELQKVDPRVDLIGINNRNLKDFTVDLEHSIRMLKKLPAEAVKVAESGISDPETVDYLRKSGFHGFLMGENFMKQEHPAEACREFINQLKR